MSRARRRSYKILYLIADTLRGEVVVAGERDGEGGKGR